jgi:hypothetical protein
MSTAELADEILKQCQTIIGSYPIEAVRLPR